jgi:hypothetical protein
MDVFFIYVTVVAKGSMIWIIDDNSTIYIYMDILKLPHENGKAFYLLQILYTHTIWLSNVAGEEIPEVNRGFYLGTSSINGGCAI